MIAANNKYSYWNSLFSDEELRRQMPRYPRLASSLKVTPYKKGLALYGGKSFEVFEGFGIRQNLSSLIPLLDGSRTIDELKNNNSGISEPDVLDLLANLFICGLLREGRFQETSSESLIYIDRLCGNTGLIQSGEQGLEKLKAANIVVYAPKVFHDKIKLLYHSSFRQLTLIDKFDINLLSSTDFLLVITDQSDTKNDPCSIFKLANERKIVAMNIELAGENARFGPMVLPQRSASYACYRQSFEPLCSDKLDNNAAKYWVSLAMHSMTLIISGVSTPSNINSITDYQWDRNRQANILSTVPRLHGWNADGKAYSLNLKPDINGYDIWKYYCGVALQTFDYYAPNSYHMHYKSKNIKSMYERPPALYTPQKMKLHVSTMSADSSELCLQHVANLLVYSAGYGTRDGLKQRYAPTGGNLGSTLAMIIVNDVKGIETGIYWFDSYTGHLEKINNIDLKQLNQVLDVDESSPMIIVSLANIFKVARKYSSFSYNICWYDSGVMYAYLKSLCDSMQLDIDNHSIPDQENILGAFKLPSSNLLVTGIMSVRLTEDKLPVSSEADKFSQLLELVKTRQAHRMWASEEITTEVAQSFATHTLKRMKKFQKQFQAELKTSVLLLLKLSDKVDGFYTTDASGKLQLKAEYPRTEHHRILSQSILSMSPIIFLPQVDLLHNLEQAGGLDIERSYRFCGSVIGDLWLRCESWGMVGTACGGCFEGEIRAVLGEHGLDKFSPLSFCIGPKPINTK